MILVLALAAAVLTACPIERATYTLRTAPQYTAEFKAVESGSDWPTDLAFGIRSEITKRTYWWLPGIPGSSERHFMYSTKDVNARDWQPPSPDGGPRPLEELEYVSTDATYHVVEEVPRRGELAPSHILAFTLGEVLWYGNGMLGQQRERPPTQFFDLTGCKSAS